MCNYFLIDLLAPWGWFICSNPNSISSGDGEKEVPMMQWVMNDTKMAHFLLPRAFIIALEVGGSLFHFSKIVASQTEKPVKILPYLKAALTLTPSRWLRLISRVHNNSARHWKETTSGTSDGSMIAQWVSCLSDLHVEADFNPPPRRVAQ